MAAPLGLGAVTSCAGLAGFASGLAAAGAGLAGFASGLAAAGAGAGLLGASVLLERSAGAGRSSLLFSRGVDCEGFAAAGAGPFCAACAFVAGAELLLAGFGLSCTFAGACCGLSVEAGVGCDTTGAAVFVSWLAVAATFVSGLLDGC